MKIREDLEGEDRLIQDGFARAENRVLTFDNDESFSRAVGVMVELMQSDRNGHTSLESALLGREIRFEIK